MKTRLLSVCVSALTLLSAQAAIANNCPTNMVVSNGWDIVKTRDFALYMGSPNKQLMLCLHRGLHANYDDDRSSSYSSVTKGVPDNSFRAMNNGFRYAPCIEVDVTARTLGDDGVSGAVLAHETLANRMTTYGNVIFGNNVSLPSNCSFDRRDTNTTYIARCKIAPLYDPATDTFRAPNAGERIPFLADPAAVEKGLQKSFSHGYLRTVYDQSQGVTADRIPKLKSLLDWVKDCRKVNNSIGLVVLDIKTADTIPVVYNEIKDYINKLPQSESSAFARHFFVKTKPWKMTKATDKPQEANWLADYLDKFYALGIPSQDTIVQSGTNNTSGSEPLSNDYMSVKKFYDNRVTNRKGQFAFEIVVPGTSQYDPIRSGKLKLKMPNGCYYTSTIDRDLSSIKSMSDTCNAYARSGSNRTSVPQIWAWVPLEDGRASKLILSDGTSAIKSPASQYISENGKYPFGIASGKGDPIPFVKNKDDQERNNNYVTDVIGARAITIDSISKFQTMFPGYTTSQTYFGATSPIK